MTTTLLKGLLAGVLFGWATAIIAMLLRPRTVLHTRYELPPTTLRELPPATLRQIEHARRAQLADLTNIRSKRIPPARPDFNSGKTR